MSKELFVSSTPHETKVAIVEEDQLAEVYFERENEYTLAGSIYKGRVTRVLPGMQSAFVNIGLERDAFLYVSDFLLEEEDEAEALEKVVTRGGRQEPRHETHVHPIEAQEILPPAEPVEAGESVDFEEQAAPAAREETEREGARKWRGRRRRGRGRDRAADRAPEPSQEAGAESATESVGPAEDLAEAAAAPDAEGEAHETAVEPARESKRHAPPAEPVRESRRSAPPAYEPILLPGESISKYQPHAAPAQPQSHAPAATIAPAPSRPMPRPSTEYSIDASSFSPGAMVLPGESIAKYRHEGTQRSETRPEPEPAVAPQASIDLAVVETAAGEVSTAEAAAPEVEPEEPGPRQSAGYSYQASLQAVAPPSVEEEVIEEDEEDQEAEAGPEGEAHAEETVEAIAPPVEHFEHPTARHEEVPAAGLEPEQGQPRHLAHEDLAHETRHRELQDQEHLAAEVIAPYMDEHFDEARAVEEDEDLEGPTGGRNGQEPAEHRAGGAGWQSSGRGLMEEEEIEEEETEFPEFEEQLDLAEFEELEEEELAPADDQLVALGGDLTEAVRDAHVNEHATGKYEAEGLEAAEEFDEAEEFGVEGEEIDFGEEAGEAEGAPAVAAGNGTPQRGERPGRGGRRGGKPGRRMRGRPRGNFPRHMPAITDLLKEGQEILVQIAKEPIAKKGARITSHIALPGRFLVYMPTVHHTGVSRKIASEEDRQRLKRIVTSERGDANGGFIVRTAAAGASEEDLRADIRFLINLWNEIRGRADNAKAPALIYHDLNLVERILRDQVTQGFSSIWVDTEQEYERVVRFVSRFQPSLLKRVKLYSKDTPLFEQFNISDEINKALKSKVWLKSGGYIVINQTEALVAIDVNTGKYVGKTARLEDTIVKTNIDAIREIVRQIRLRDLGGIIVIDFIDMDERKNRHKVMQALEDALKADRAPSKVLQFNDFGLVAITRKRVKQSLERTLGQQCPICTGTGMVKSVSTICNEIYVEMRKMSRHFERDVVLRVNPEVAKALKSNGARWLQEMEDLTRRTILIKSDALLHPEQFDIQ